MRASVVATVTAADVLLEDPLLERGLTIVDTPGVGGMTRGHRDITNISGLNFLPKSFRGGMANSIHDALVYGVKSS